MQERRPPDPRQHERGALRHGAVGQVGVEREVPAPGLVYHQGGAVAMRHRREQRHVRHRAVEAGGDDDRGARAGCRAQRGVERDRRDAVGDAGGGIGIGREPVRREAGDDEPGERGGMDVALDDDLAAAGGVQGEAGGDVGLAALGERPCACCAPGAGGALERIAVVRTVAARRRRQHRLPALRAGEEAPGRRRVTAAVGEPQAAEEIAAGGTRGGGRMRATR